VRGPQSPPREVDRQQDTLSHHRSDALKAAREESGRPSLIQVRTHIGFGSPRKQDTVATQGEPLGLVEVRLTKEGLGWPVQDSLIDRSDWRSLGSGGVDQHRIKIRLVNVA
jgi:transketolase